jgi:hypothetical protein
MQNYTRTTVQGIVSGRHSALVDAAADILDAMVPADVVNLMNTRRARATRLDDLVAAVALSYDVLPA